MNDNWYETAVSVSAPHNIISVIDWASDAPAPKVPEVVSGTYKVFKWGVNDRPLGNALSSRRKLTFWRPLQVGTLSLILLILNSGGRT